MLASLSSSSSIRRSARMSAGVALAVPSFALFQATLLLLEYRLNHSDTPRPVSPSQGVVKSSVAATGRDSKGHEAVASVSWLSSWFRSSSSCRNKKQSVTRASSRHYSTHRPLRLLVIGDSLAAGVGVSRSNLPVLPQSIAQSLSRAHQGREVQWTCVGTPGYSATQILQDVYELDDNFDKLQDGGDNISSYIQRLEYWQQEQYKAVLSRWGAVKQRATEWWQIRGKDENGDSRDPPSSSWLSRARRQIERDVEGFRTIFQVESNTNKDSELLNAEEKPTLSSTNNNNQLTQRRPTMRKLARKQSILHPHVGEFDVAVVLTGINDLKDAFLPFMMSRQRRREENRSNGLRDNLILLVDALRMRMGISAEVDDLKKKRNPKPENSCSRCGMEGCGDADANNTQKGDNESSGVSSVGPLMVFPAIPTVPTSLNQLVPLCWFLVPLIQSMDRHKQRLAERYPELVLFVRAPNNRVFLQAEESQQLGSSEGHRGGEYAGLDDFDQQRLRDNTRTDVRLHGNHRFWPADDQQHDELGQYIIAEDSVTCLKEWEFTAPGSSLISADGIHPNDEGYHAWGEVIGEAIVDEWRSNAASA